jgi:hypothetical protein
MTTVIVGLEKGLRLSGTILIVGLGVEAICLLWARPIAFIVLVPVGGFLCAAGIIMYLYSLISAGEHTPPR